MQRGFTDFEDCWSTSLLGSSIGPRVAAMLSFKRTDGDAKVQPRSAKDGIPVRDWIISSVSR